MKKNTDERVLDLFQKVREKTKRISASKIRPNWETNCSFAYSENGSRINLHTIANKGELINIYSFILQKESFNELASKELCGRALKTGWLGFSFENWKNDIKSKYDNLLLDEEKKELKVLEDRLDKLISVEQRREMELEAIEKELHNDKG